MWKTTSGDPVSWSNYDINDAPEWMMCETHEDLSKKLWEPCDANTMRGARGEANKRFGRPKWANSNGNQQELHVGILKDDGSVKILSTRYVVQYGRVKWEVLEGWEDHIPARPEASTGKDSK